MMRRQTAVTFSASVAGTALAICAGFARADGPLPAVPSNGLVTIACRDREDPGVGATLVFDLARRRLVSSSNMGHNILFDDRDVPVHVSTAAIDWQVAQNSYMLNRTTLELNVAGRVYLCRLAKRQL